MEGDALEKHCPQCDGKRIRVSRYEWYLADALQAELEKSGRRFTVTEQWELPDHRGFSWYFDLAVSVEGASYFGGITELIEIQGPTHAHQAVYSGPGGGYTRDHDKHWEVFNVHRLHKSGYDFRAIPATECRRSVIRITAETIAAQLVNKADTFS